jgi:hypothetical protein
MQKRYDEMRMEAGESVRIVSYLPADLYRSFTQSAAAAGMSEDEYLRGLLR